MAIALGIVGLTTLFLTLGEAVPQMRGKVELVEDSEHRVGRNVRMNWIAVNLLLYLASTMSTPRTNLWHSLLYTLVQFYLTDPDALR